MVGVYELDLEAARRERVAGLERTDVRLVHELVLLELALYQTCGESGGVDGSVHLAEQIGDRAYVVLVAVGDRYRADLVPVLDEVGEIRYDQIHTVHIVLGKTQAAVDDEYVAAVFVYGYVLADLVETAERYYLQFLCFYFCH